MGRKATVNQSAARVKPSARTNGGVPRAPRMSGLEFVREEPLAFSDLEVPVRPLLTLPEETRIGARIRTCLRRLSVLLPLHPEGNRRFLARIEEILCGGPPVFSWFHLRERMEADLTLASRSFDRARGAFESASARAMKLYEDGVETLERYRLDPETLHRWSREAAGSLSHSRPFGKVPRFRKVDRILRKVVRVLERERDKLVLPNFRLILKEVFRYRPVGMKRSDLFQEGIIGLQKAVFRFDSTRGIRFSTYATYWIRQSIRKSLTDKARLIRVPQAVQEELRKKECSLAATEANRVRRILGGTILFSYGESDDSTDRFSFDIADPSAPELGEELRMRRMPHAVQEAMDVLSSRQRMVLQRRFGLAGERPQTLDEIGTHLNLSRERIRQIEQEAIAVMRKSKGLHDLYEDLSHAGVTAAETHN